MPARQPPGRLRRSLSRGLAIAWLAVTAMPTIVAAEPWIAPGDLALRNDLQQLADAGIVHAPVISWPLPWTDIAADVAAADPAKVTPALQFALQRVQARAARATRADHYDVRLDLAGTTDPWAVRTFEDTPREEGEAGASAAWLGSRFAWKAAVTFVADPSDGQEVRPDGSYVAMHAGNWNLSAGYLDRWWGPGWQGSLILSNNARPVPAVAIDRNEARASTLPVLRWLGPWRFSTFMGQLEKDRDYPNTLLFGMRAEIRPVPSLQLAASRSAQWCGDGRPCDWGTFGDLLVGNDNDQPTDEQPGNQLAGFDLRWSWPGGRLPLAFYAQAIGEDEAGFLPSKYLGLAGIEAWGGGDDHNWRVAVEYADTACDFVNSTPQWGCAYSNAIYTSGYRYRGRSLGAPIDGDGTSLGLMGLYADNRGWEWSLQMRSMELNRAGAEPEHSLSPGGPADVWDVQLGHVQNRSWGKLSVSVGYASIDSATPVAMDDGLRGSLSVEWLTH